MIVPFGRRPGAPYQLVDSLAVAVAATAHMPTHDATLTRATTTSSLMQDPNLSDASWSALRPSYETESLVYRDLHVHVHYATAVRGSKLIVPGERDATGLR